MAVGPEGMIMAEGEYIAWYSGPLAIRETYRQIRDYFTEDIYVTLEELDEVFFTLEMERRNTLDPMEKDKQSQIKLYYAKNLENPDDEEIIYQGKVDAYAGNVGTRFLLNYAFRKANMKLNKNGYEEINWHYEGRKYIGDSVKRFQFTKKNARGVYAVLEVTDAREKL